MEQPLDTLMHCISTAASRGEERDRQREKKGKKVSRCPHTVRGPVEYVMFIQLQV